MRVVILGEALLDFIATDPVPLHEASQYTRCLGGAASNVAAGLYYHGVQSSLISRVGRDQLGQQVMIELKRSGLSTAFVQVDQKWPTKCTFISHDEQGNRYIEIANRQSADQHITIEQVRDATHNPFDLLYISGVMLISERGAELVSACIRAAKEKAARVAFDPVFNIAKAAKPVQERMAWILQFVDILKVNDAELNALQGPLNGNGPSPGLILHTKGEHGASVLTGDSSIDIDVIPTHCTDPTGAGDAFFSAFLAGMLADGGGVNEKKPPKMGKSGCPECLEGHTGSRCNNVLFAPKYPFIACFAL